MMYFLPEAAPLVSPSAAVSAAVVSDSAAVSAAAVPAAVVSAGLLEPHPATVNAMMAAMDNAIIFFIITSSSTDLNKIRVTLIHPVSLDL